MAVKMSNSIADELEINIGIDFTDQMVFGHQFFEGDHFELVLLWGRLF